MKDFMSLTSWIVFALAACAWAGVVYGNLWLHTEAQKRGSSAQTAEQRSSETAYASRLRILAGETVVERERLENLARADIVTIANTIEGAGRSAGVVAKVSAAIPVGNPVEVPGGAPLHTISFIVQAEGTFAGVVQFVRILESFPSFSSVEQFEFEKVQLAERPSQSWRSIIRLHIHTTSDISS